MFRRTLSRVFSINNASPLIAKAITEVISRKQAILNQQMQLLHENSLLLQNRANFGISELVEYRMKQDKLSLINFRKYLKYLSITNPILYDSIPYAVRNQKMDLRYGVIDGARTKIFGDDETNIAMIASGEFPNSVVLNTSDTDGHSIPTLGKGAFFGTLMPAFLSYAIIVINRILGGSKSREDSEIYHTSLLPMNIPSEVYKDCTFFCGSNRFGFIHSGYIRGGTRDECNSLYKENKQFGPKDCIEWVLGMTGLCEPFYPQTLRENFYSSQQTSKYLSDAIEPIDIEHAKPGDIHLHFDSANYCSEGHISLLVDVIKTQTETRVYTIGCSRHTRSNIDGFGIQEFVYNNDEIKNNKEKFFGFLRLKDQLPMVHRVQGRRPCIC